MDNFDQTSGSLAREAGTSVPTVNKYADLGVLEYRRASNGTRLFKRGQAEIVRNRVADALAARGHHPKTRSA